MTKSYTKFLGRNYKIPVIAFKLNEVLSQKNNAGIKRQNFLFITKSFKLRKAP